MRALTALCCACEPLPPYEPLSGGCGHPASAAAQPLHASGVPGVACGCLAASMYPYAMPLRSDLVPISALVRAQERRSTNPVHSPVALPSSLAAHRKWLWKRTCRCRRPRRPPHLPRQQQEQQRQMHRKHRRHARLLRTCRSSRSLRHLRQDLCSSHLRLLHRSWRRCRWRPHRPHRPHRRRHLLAKPHSSRPRWPQCFQPCRPQPQAWEREPSSYPIPSPMVYQPMRRRLHYLPWRQRTRLWPLDRRLGCFTRT